MILVFDPNVKKINNYSLNIYQGSTLLIIFNYSHYIVHLINNNMAESLAALWRLTLAEWAITQSTWYKVNLISLDCNTLNCKYE